ncbi:UNVERIFIED_CONTAM: Kinesin-like protein kif16b [Gekko kuhli]
MFSKEQTLALRKEGIGVVLDSELPHLIGIDDDLLSTGIILYHLKEGRTHVGREDAVAEQDIVLHGLDLESEHCIFEHFDGTVNLIPLRGAQCSVNGVQITEATQLNQGTGLERKAWLMSNGTKKLAGLESYGPLLWEM